MIWNKISVDDKPGNDLEKGVLLHTSGKRGKGGTEA